MKKIYNVAACLILSGCSANTLSNTDTVFSSPLSSQQSGYVLPDPVKYYEEAEKEVYINQQPKVYTQPQSNVCVKQAPNVYNGISRTDIEYIDAYTPRRRNISGPMYFYPHNEVRLHSGENNAPERIAN